MDELFLFGVGVPALTAAAVNVFKALGLLEKWWPWATLGTGILFAYLATAVTHYPQIVPYVQPAVYGLLIFAMATGIYHTAKNFGQAVGIVSHSPDPTGASDPKMDGQP